MTRIVILIAACVPGVFTLLVMIPVLPFLDRFQEVPGVLFGMISPIATLVAVVTFFRVRRAIPGMAVGFLGILVALAVIGTWQYWRTMSEYLQGWT